MNICCNISNYGSFERKNITEESKVNVLLDQSKEFPNDNGNQLQTHTSDGEQKSMSSNVIPTDPTYKKISQSNNLFESQSAILSSKNQADLSNKINSKPGKSSKIVKQ